MIRPLLLSLSFPVLLSAQSADLAVHISATPRAGTDHIDAVVEVETKVALREPDGIALDVLGSFVEQDWKADPDLQCEKKGDNWLRCSVTAMPAGSKTRLSFRGEPWYSSGSRYVLANIEWKEKGLRAEKRNFRRDAYVYAHELVVANTDDSGPGSLRQVIEDAKPLCTQYDRPCLIRFDLGEGAVIRPLTALPEVSGVQLVLDGESKVTLDGSLLSVPVNGLRVGGRGANMTLRGLAVRSFGENGIELASGQDARIENCVITNNRSRGVVVSTGFVQIRDSVLSGNGRSGIFVTGGSAIIERNLIGVAPDGVTPMPNGASGIFATGYSVWVADNLIAHNAHWGVAMPLDNRDVDVGRNRIVDNRFGAFDVGLDGPSFFPRAPVGVFNYVAPNGPALHSAVYDVETNRTVVTGRLENVEFMYFLTYDLQFWATNSVNEADEFLGAIHITQPDFTVSFPGDLRGRLIAGNTIRWVHDEITDRGTSELSAPIEVR